MRVSPTSPLPPTLPTPGHEPVRGRDGSDTRDRPVPSGEGEARGVVRLLEAGHFKGVAAVRLSIVHHDELAARRAASAEAELGAAIADLGAGVSETLASAGEAAPEQQEALETARTTFSTAIDDISAALAAGETDREATVGGIQTAFDELMRFVESLLETPASGEAAAVGAGEISAEAVPASDPAADSVAPSASLAAALQTLYDGFRESAQASLDASRTEPEFTPPNGNGVAFERFVAMYRQLADPVPPEADAPAEAEPAAVDRLA